MKFNPPGFIHHRTSTTLYVHLYNWKFQRKIMGVNRIPVLFCYCFLNATRASDHRHILFDAFNDIVYFRWPIVRSKSIFINSFDVYSLLSSYIVRILVCVWSVQFILFVNHNSLFIVNSHAEVYSMFITQSVCCLPVCLPSNNALCLSRFTGYVSATARFALQWTRACSRWDQ